MKNKLNSTPVVWALALICCALWGSAFPCIKIGYRLLHIASGDSASQLLFAGVRFAVAGVMVIIVGSAIKHKPLLPKRGDIKCILCLAMLQTILQYIFFYIGLAHTTGVKGSIIGSTNVFLAILISALIFRREDLTARKLIGCAIGFTGVILVNMHGLSVSINFPGDVFIFISAISCAFSAVYISKFSEDHDPVLLSGWQFLIGGIVLTSAGKILGGHLGSLSAASFALLIYMAFISAAAYTIWSILLKHNPVSKVLVFGFMNPVFGVALSALLLHENGQAGILPTIISLALVCFGIITVQRDQNAA